MAAYLLAPIANFNEILLNTRVHDRFFPFALLPTLHAGRIAYIHASILKNANRTASTPTTWLYNIVGFLIMCWGGGFIASYLIGQTPFQLLTVYPLVNYVATYIVVKAFLQYVSHPSAKIADTVLILIDGALRTHAVIATITMVKSSNNVAVRNSLLLQVLCGTIGATGGGQLAVALDALSPHGWSLQTPPLLRATSIVQIIDIIAAAASSLLYGMTTLSHPAYAPFLAQIHNGGDHVKPLFSASGARAACTLLFSIAFAYRAVVLHWLPEQPTVAPKVTTRQNSQTTKKKQ